MQINWLSESVFSLLLKPATVKSPASEQKRTTTFIEQIS